VSFAGPGEAGLVTRRLDRRFDPVELQARLDSPFLFRRTGERALLLVDSALKVEATGEDATVEALSESGDALLDIVAGQLAANVTARDGR
jgi:hypothetical protein